MRRVKGGIAGLAMMAACVLGSRGRAAIAPHVSDPNTVVLYHLDEASGTASAHAADYVISDVDANVTLRTGVGVSPFDGTTGPDGLGTALTSWTDWKRSFRDSGTDTSLFSTTAFTVEGWVRDPGTLGGGLDTGVNTIFRVAGGGEVRFGVKESGGEKKLFLIVDVATVDTEFLSDPVTFDTEAWYHAAVTYDDNGAGTADDSTIAFTFTSEAAYNSGLQSAGGATGAADLDVFSSSGICSIGETSGDDHFNGYLDEVRYSNVVRDSAERIPEPAGLGALGLALLATRRRRG